MNEILVLDISRVSINYFSNNIEAIQNKGAVRLKTKTDFKDIENSNNHIANVSIDMIVNNDKSVFENKIIEDNQVDARLKVTFKIVFSYVKGKQKIEKEDMLNIAEPYIRKEIMDFCNELDIPKVPLPYRAWK